jgi:hypothetical protein
VERRSVVLHRATVRGHGRQAIEAELIDISIYGCRVEADHRFNPGDRLWLRFSGSAPVAGVAVWIEGMTLGCRFDEPLDRALFRALTLTL